MEGALWGSGLGLSRGWVFFGLGSGLGWRLSLGWGRKRGGSRATTATATATATQAQKAEQARHPEHLDTTVYQKAMECSIAEQKTTQCHNVRCLHGEAVGQRMAWREATRFKIAVLHLQCVILRNTSLCSCTCSVQYYALQGCVPALAVSALPEASLRSTHPTPPRWPAAPYEGRTPPGTLPSFPSRGGWLLPAPIRGCSTQVSKTMLVLVLYYCHPTHLLPHVLPASGLTPPSAA